MRLRFAASLALIALAATTALGARQGGKDHTALVSVVADASGPQRSLTAADFVVHEDKGARTVTGAELATMPLSVAMLIDTTQANLGAKPPILDLREGLKAFIQAIKSREPDAQIAYIPIAGAAVTEVDFTADSAPLLTAVGRLVPDQRSQSVMLEGLSAASRRIAERPAPRRAILTLDLGSEDTSNESTVKKVADEVHKSGATVWSISVVSSTGQSSPIRDNILNAVTKNSGGMRLSALDASALTSMFMRVANSLQSQYSVTFERDGQPKPEALTFETKAGGKVLLSPFMR